MTDGVQAMADPIEQAEAVAVRAQAANPQLQPLDPRPMRHVHHGQTGAMWTAVVIEIVGFIVGGISLMLGPNWPLFAIAAAICVVGIIVGVTMQKLGFGIYEKHQKS